MHSTPTLKITAYGIAYADNIFELSELVNHQLSKGYQPYNGVTMLDIYYCQVLVKYGTRISSKKTTPIIKSKKSSQHVKLPTTPTKKNRSRSKSAA